MTNESDPRPAAGLFGEISEVDRRAALDVFGRFLIEVRDQAIVQWDQIFAGKRRYAPWERLVGRSPDINQECISAMGEALPHILDTFMYCFLADLDASQSIRVSVDWDGRTAESIAKLSWGPAAEPTGENGWLVRFSKQRFEQPY
jgi:hypothetical protein